MSDLISTQEYRGYTIELHYDSDPDNPREWGWPDVMYLNRSDYKGDGHSIMELLDDNDKLTKDFLDNHVWLWIDYYEHSGIALSTRMPETKRSRGWDSGLFGIIAVSKADIKKETKHKIVTKKDREQYIRMLEGQVETYNQYIMGEVYGYIVNAPDDDGWVGDSCWGYYGDSDYCISEAKEAIDSRIDELEAEKCDEVDNIMYFDAITEPFWID